jgi:hypothetical protein
MTRLPGRDHDLSYLGAILGRIVLPIVVFSAFLLACVHIAPQELVDARIAFDRAADGPARTYTPVELNIAEDALDRAQEMFQANGDTARVRDQATTALRMAELVEAMARIAEAQQRQVDAAP